MSTGKRYIVSACLAGIYCRYNGQRQTHPAVIKLIEEGRAIPVCPEQIGGLATPRPPCEIVEDRVLAKTGEDCTHAYELGAEECLRLAKLAGCTAAVLQPRSPSCGIGQIYDGTFSGHLIPGDGILARMCRENGIELHLPDDLRK